MSEKNDTTTNVIMTIEEVETLLRVKYNVPQDDIDYLDDEYKLKLLQDLQEIREKYK